MIKRKVSESTFGLMEENMKECGPMGNSMGKVNSTMLKGKARGGFGKMVKESNGLIKKMSLVEGIKLMSAINLQVKIQSCQQMNNSKLLIFD